MQYVSREGDIEILDVTTVSEPKTPLNFTVDEPAQLLWVNLSPSNSQVFILCHAFMMSMMDGTLILI